ncbi:MAG: GDSL-type esterase/lipase family protein [Cyanobacteria bacterium P01_A01_bin.123]
MDVRICFIGDSFVNGTGDPTYLGWTGRVCAEVAQQGHAVTAYNLGIRRETSLQIEQRWPQEVVCRLPNDCQGRLVFSFGANDMTVEQGSNRVDLATSIAAARRLLQAASRQYPVLMVGPPAIAVNPAHTDRITHLSAQYGDLCHSLGVPYLETCRLTAQSVLWSAEVQAGDGAHPGAGGYGELATLVSNWSAWRDWFDID